MGKKKSVVLMVLISIVIAVLCAVTAFPAFTIPGTNGVEKWNPVVLQYDLGADFGGGYYAYYYPEGVISDAEYKDNLAAFEGDEEATQEYDDKYIEIAGSSLHFSTEDKLNIVSGDKLSEEFVDNFNAAASEISARLAKKGYSDYRVAVVDGYALRIELPASENSDKASAVFQFLAMTGEMDIRTGGTTIEALTGKDDKITNIVKSFSIGSIYNTNYLKIKLTDEGESVVAGLKSTLSASSSSTDSSATTLDFVIGEQTILSAYSDNITDDNEIRLMYVDAENKDYLDTVKILLDSVLENGGYEITLTADSVRSFEPVYGENALTLLYIALGVAILAFLVLPAFKMGRYGIVSTYGSLSYFIVTAICFAFITGGTFEITVGSVAIFLFGLALTNALQYHIYKAIKKEFSLGKTVDSSIKGGYKKTILSVVDVYAVLTLGALALLIGGAGVTTMALQALICVITGAFINLLWARAINYVYLSASKDKYGYFRFVREDDDDE